MLGIASGAQNFDIKDNDTGIWFNLPDTAKLEDTLQDIADLTKGNLREWWDKAWTFQELLLPRDCIVLCSTNTVNLDYFHYCYNVGAYEEKILDRSSELILGTRNLLKRKALHERRLPPYDLERILMSRRQAKMSDPRDFFYSVLGLFPDSTLRALPPDYSISIRDLFTARWRFI